MNTTGFKTLFHRYGLYFAWSISFVATAGSLYFSEILHWVPCTLCWYQRIFMYPQVLLLGMTAFRDDKRIIPYLLPFSGIGASISLLHYFQQKVPGFTQIVACKVGVPCHLDYLNGFGWITIPLLAFIAFVGIAICLWMVYKQPASRFGLLY